MSSLAALTYEHHKNAERNVFAKHMVSGKINKDDYAVYLYNLYPQYNVLEKYAKEHGILDLEIAPKIFDDFIYFSVDYVPKTFKTTKRYIDYIENIKNDPHRLMAHVYVRHMGDLSGGQLIKKKIIGKKSMYEFSDNIDYLKTKIRSRCSDDMADEANICFAMVTEFFIECANEFNLG